MSSNQKKIRDIERQMKKFGPDNAELKKRLEDLKAVKEEVQVKEKLRKNSVKYHMVKFIERKKVTRAIRSIDSKLEKNDPDSVNLKAKKLQLEEDLAYIMYYPMEQKYIALFPGTEKAAGETNNKQFNSKSYDDQMAQAVEKSVQLSKSARVLALQAWRFDQTNGRVDKVAHAMEVEYNGGNGKKKGSNDDEDKEYHKYTNNLQPSSALSQFQARNPDKIRSRDDEFDKPINKKTDKQSKRQRNEDNESLDKEPPRSEKKQKKNNNNSNSEEVTTTQITSDGEDLNNDNSRNSSSSVQKKDKKEKKTKSDSVATNKTATEVPVVVKGKEEQTDSFFLEEVNEEEEALAEEIEAKMKKNVSELQDIRKVVNKNKYDNHKRLYGNKKHDNQYSQNKHHKKF